MLISLIKSKHLCEYFCVNKSGRYICEYKWVTKIIYFKINLIF